MSFDWSTYLDVAKDLAEQAAEESTARDARLRSAISRAYYATFCCARNRLRDVEGDTAIPTTGESHGYIRDQFKKGDSDRRKVGANLDRLHKERNKADYQDTFPNLRGTAELALKLAERAITNLRR